MNELSYIDTIIKKLESDNTFDEREKACIEKALKVIDYYDKILNQALGLEPNTVGLKFCVKD